MSDVRTELRFPKLSSRSMALDPKSTPVTCSHPPLSSAACPLVLFHRPTSQSRQRVSKRGSPTLTLRMWPSTFRARSSSDLGFQFRRPRKSARLSRSLHGMRVWTVCPFYISLTYPQLLAQCLVRMSAAPLPVANCFNRSSFRERTFPY